MRYLRRELLPVLLARQQFRLGGISRHLVQLGMDAGFLAGEDLVADVDLRGGVVAHEDDRDAGQDSVPGLEGGDALRVFGAELPGDGLAVDDARCH